MANVPPVVPKFEPNPALRVLYSWFFDAIDVDDAWVRRVRELARQGSVVYVLRNLNPVDFLALDHLTKRYDLPQVGFVNDLRLGLFNPIQGSFFHTLARRRRASPSTLLREALEDGGSAALFLKRPPSVVDVVSGASGGRGLKEGDELMRTLIDLQRERERPILLVPQVFLWTNRPDTHGSHYLDVFMGPREWPSSLRTIGQFLYNYKHVLLRAGEPLDLARYLEGQAGPSNENHVRRVMYVMLRRLERERRAVTGPAQTPPDRQRQQVLRSPKLQKIIMHLAGDKPQDRYAITRKSLDILKEMQATPDTATLKVTEVVLDRLFHRVYAGIDVDREGIERIRERSKESTIVLLPSHKSNVDYLVLSYVFNYENLSLPLIAAGDNLSFFPLGPVLRRIGGFFIRRQFGGDRLYSASVEAYVRRLIRDGYTLELFIEGGRSRTGKLLKPQIGMLSMLVDAATTIPNREVVFVPISIGYERIVETTSYGRELIGGDKQKEDAQGLLRAAGVFRNRYGRINIQFGTQLTIDDICADLEIDRAAMQSPAKRRAVVARFGARTLDEINRVTAVTPGSLTALALLSDERRSLSHEELLQRCRHLLRVLTDMKARLTPRVAADGELRDEAIFEAVQMFVDAELLETHRPGDFPSERERRTHRAGVGALYRVPERKRIELDVSKNIIVHFFVERALMSIAILMPPGPELALATVRDRTRELSDLFKHEFRLNGNGRFEVGFDATLQAMQAAGEIELFADGRIDLGSGRDGWNGQVWLRTYAAVLRNFLEGYRVAARSLGGLLRGPLLEKELLKRSLALGHRMYLGGEIERHEAVSKPILQNALLAFKDEGYVQLREGKYSLTTSFDSADAVRAIEGRLAGYLEANED
jgi:glycerol-3-phosphate O-acyltransferase